MFMMDIDSNRVPPSSVNAPANENLYGGPAPGMLVAHV